MTLILEIPPQTETRLRSIANARGETLEAFTVSQLEKVATEHGATGPAKTETREQRRARIHAAIDAAQADFAHIKRVFGDPVSALMADKRADAQREEERGL